MHPVRSAFAVLTLSLSVCAVADAQSLPSASRAIADFGFSVGKLAPRIYGDWVTSDMAQPSLEVRAAVPVTPTFSIEGLTMIGRRDNEYFTRTEGLYMVYAKQRLPRLERRGLKPFVTYGIAGYYAYVTQQATLVPQPHGGTIVRPKSTYRELDAPIATAFGGGIEQVIARQLAVRADAQLVTVLYMPLAVRLSAGVSIPFGSYSRN